MNDSITAGLKSVRSGNKNRRKLFEDGQMYMKNMTPSENPQDSFIDQANIEVNLKQQQIIKFQENEMDPNIEKFQLNQVASNQPSSKHNYNPGDLPQIWKKRGFNILKLIQRFIMQIKRQTNQIRFRELLKHQFAIINDYSCEWKYYRQKDMLKGQQPRALSQVLQLVTQKCNCLFNIQKEKRTILPHFFGNKIDTFNPDSKLKVCWDALILLLLMLAFMFLPLKFAYQDGHSFYQVDFGVTGEAILAGTGWLLLIDILVKLNTEVYCKGEIIKSRKKIRQFLIKQGFFKDLMAVIMFVTSIMYDIPYLQAIIFTQCYQLVERMNRLIERLNLQVQELAMVNLYKLILLILFIGHLCTCGFSLMYSIEMNNNAQMTWLDSAQLSENASWAQVYVSGLYWATITMITVGYGDIHPCNATEQIVIIVITFISCGVFAYAVNQIGQIIDQITKRNTLFRTRMFQLTNHLNRKGLPSHLQIKVKKYFEYLQEENVEENLVCEEMITQLPASLRQEVSQDFNYRIIQNHKLFKFNFTPEFLREISLQLREKKCFAEEVIFEQNTDNDNIYFLVKGEVLLYLQSRNNKAGVQKGQYLNGGNNSNGACANNSNIEDIHFYTLRMGEIFNEVCFFSQQTTKYRAVSKNLAVVYYIRREDFVALLEKHERDFQTFQMFKDNINCYQNYRGLESRCFSCRKFTHQLETCAHVQFLPALAKVVQRMKEESMIKQERKQIKRKDKTHFHTLSFCEELQQSILNYIFENGDDQQIEDMIERLKVIMEQLNASTSNIQNNTNPQHRSTLVSNSSRYQKENSLSSKKSILTNTLQNQYEQSQKSTQNSIKSQRNKQQQQQQQLLENSNIVNHHNSNDNSLECPSGQNSSSSSNTDRSNPENEQGLSDFKMGNTILYAPIEDSKSVQSTNKSVSLTSIIEHKVSTQSININNNNNNNEEVVNDQQQQQQELPPNMFTSVNNYNKSNSLGMQSPSSSQPHSNQTKGSGNKDKQQGMILTSLREFEKKRKSLRKKRIIFTEQQQPNSNNNSLNNSQQPLGSFSNIGSSRSNSIFSVKNQNYIRFNNMDEFRSDDIQTNDGPLIHDKVHNWEHYFTHNNFSSIFADQIQMQEKYKNEISFSFHQKKMNEERLLILMQHYPTSHKHQSLKKKYTQQSLFFPGNNSISKSPLNVRNHSMNPLLTINPILTELEN